MSHSLVLPIDGKSKESEDSEPTGQSEHSGDRRRRRESSGTASSCEEVYDRRLTDPFYRGLDTTLRIEKEIRMRAVGMLQTLEVAPWKVGGPAAQLVEMTSAFRIYIESYVRSSQEIARAEVWEIMR